MSPKKLEALIMRLLSQNPSEKFYSASSFVETLGRKRRLMDFDSLINHERHDIIQGFRKKMELPEEERQVSQNRTDEESTIGLPQALMEELGKKVSGSGDSLLGVIVVLGLICCGAIVWVGWPTHLS